MAFIGWYRLSYDVAVQNCDYEAPASVTATSFGWQSWPPGFTCDWTYDDGQVRRHFVDLFPG
ncbi:hypothetical protein [Actinopolymorpha alba]|uniref:hypothetical protein n=1 Tax=Actinopolymorpha alba TaxID=533267 RepID=UPI0012F67EEB|nr:hypothetical protein [Actinopolymorpha alba]